jgi:hypothetical protein
MFGVSSCRNQGYTADFNQDEFAEARDVVQSLVEEYVRTEAD